jgi:hypothetical protein
VTRITFAGALFLAIVAVSPSVIALGFPDLGALGLGGTSLLTVVSWSRPCSDRSPADDEELRRVHPMRMASA